MLGGLLLLSVLVLAMWKVRREGRVGFGVGGEPRREAEGDGGPSR